MSRTTVLYVSVPLPALNASMYWHERHHEERAHAWVRQLIAGTLAAAG